MDPNQASKTDSSKAQMRWVQETPRWQRRLGALIKATAIAAVLVLGYTAFVPLSFDHERKSWSWMFSSQQHSGEQYETRKGSQFLIGVGKADITGYSFPIFKTDNSTDGSPDLLLRST